MIGIHRYKSNATQLASPAQIVMMLFETALRRLDSAEAKLIMDEGDLIGDLHRVREIVIELHSALDYEAAPELCATLGPLYQWMRSELVALGSDRDVAHLHAVREALIPLAEGWRGAVEGGRQLAVAG